MPSIARQELSHMRDTVFFEGDDVRAQLSRFWILLALSSVIASAGVVGDSTATVIGAMIVAPLMIPIQGTMLAVVLGDRANLLRSVGLVAAGALCAVAIGWLVGFVVRHDVVAATNAQVAGRVNPRLIDLLAALATGAVGSIALVRRDISDTLPGVAIAISLVPPLTVVGLTLEAGEVHEAAGALLLFVTNVVAIIGVGMVVMALYHVHRLEPAPSSTGGKAVNRRNAVLVVVASVLVVGVTLAGSSSRIAAEVTREEAVWDAASSWGEPAGWKVMDVASRRGRVLLTVAGPLPAPDIDALRDELRSDGVDPADVTVELVPIETIDLGEPAS